MTQARFRADGKEIRTLTFYIAAAAIGGTLGLLFASGVILFFHFVTEERRRKISSRFMIRSRRRQPFHTETVVSK
jgi:hypothetical protein